MTSRFDYQQAFGRLLRSAARQLAGDAQPASSPEWQKTLSRTVNRYAPPGNHGPLPTALLLHGCTGDKAHLADWGRLLAQNGFLVYTIDSFSARNIGPIKARCLVCTGLMLQGGRRSRDLTAALSIALEDPCVDRQRINLVGWSHGAWTIMEWMVDGAGGVLAKHTDAAIRSLVLTYPYCGLASAIHAREWTHMMPVMIVMAERDRVVSNKKTAAFAQKLARRTSRVKRMLVQNAGHAFDVEGTPHYDLRAAIELRNGVLDFLTTVN